MVAGASSSTAVGAAASPAKAGVNPVGGVPVSVVGSGAPNRRSPAVAIAVARSLNVFCASMSAP